MPTTPAPRVTLAVALVVALVTTGGLATAAPSPAGPSSAGPADEGMDLAVTTGYMPTFGKAVGAAGIGNVLAAPGPLTLFAPTEAAFARLAPGVLDELLRPENRDRLRALVLNHVVAGRLPAASLGGGAQLLTLDGRTLEVTSGADGLAVDGALVTGPDVATRNGVIHFIDRVLLPPG